MRSLFELAAIDDVIDAPACEYFTRYGNEGRPGSCLRSATLELVDSNVWPAIRVCVHHAHTIVSRYPMLGDVEHRFSPIGRPR